MILPKFASCLYLTCVLLWLIMFSIYLDFLKMALFELLTAIFHPGTSEVAILFSHFRQTYPNVKHKGIYKALPGKVQSSYLLRKKSTPSPKETAFISLHGQNPGLIALLLVRGTDGRLVEKVTSRTVPKKAKKACLGGFYQDRKGKCLTPTHITQVVWGLPL